MKAVVRLAMAAMCRLLGEELLRLTLTANTYTTGQLVNISVVDPDPLGCRIDPDPDPLGCRIDPDPDPHR